MRAFEIRLLSHTGRVADVYSIGANTINDAVDRARELLQDHPEMDGAQVCGWNGANDVAQRMVH